VTGRGHSAALLLAVQVVLSGGLLAAAPGCAPAARLWVIPAEHDRMDPARPMAAEYDLAGCWFHVGEGDEIRVVLANESLAPEGSAGRRSVDLSLVLPGLPASYGRYYAANQRTLRGLIHEGDVLRRYGSLQGVISVAWGDGRDTLRGRFRVWAKEQDFKIWRGWSGKGRTLLLGEFTARRHPRRATELFERTNSGGLQRRPPGEGLPRPVTGPPIQEPEPVETPPGGG